MAESVGSNFLTVHHPAQNITNRVIWALSHRLAFLHRPGPQFNVLGSTANVYTVTISTSPSCTCPDCTTPGKHILFVLLRALSLPFDDPCIYHVRLLTSHVARTLSVPSAPDVMANARAIARFHQVFDERNSCINVDNVKEGEVCPICLKEMEE